MEAAKREQLLGDIAKAIDDHDGELEVVTRPIPISPGALIEIGESTRYPMMVFRGLRARSTSLLRGEAVATA
jgi:hypothetical protein